MNIDRKTLLKAAIWACKREQELAKHSRCHWSHNVSQALQESDSRYGLESYGVEVDIDYDIIYLNMGDAYAETIVHHNGKYRVTTWGDIAEKQL